MSGLDPKASYALSQSVRSSKEAFENYRALDVNTDQYCRLAGALNPESSDTEGRDELMGIFNSGYQGKTGLAAIKEYLTDMYDRSINPALDANKSDSEGGRKDSIRKCFGLNVRDPIVLTNERIGSGSTTSSSRSQFDVPPNPGLSPAYCLFEVGSPDARSPWKGNPAWEANAPPLGSGVYWLWGTSDGFGERPANEAFSFYHNFVNTGSTVTNAVIAGGVDNYGYVVLNGTKYPSSNVHSDKGYEGFQNIIQPFTVTLPRGPNTLEVRAVNSGGSVRAAQNNGGWKNPGGMWLTIKVNNNFIVKTGCDGWKCTRFFYPQEVFHATVYNKTLADAPSVCQRLGARVATYAELDEAQKNHANWCSTGWVSDKGNRNAFYPITYQIEGGCGNGRSGIIDWIGDDNWFQRWGDKSGVGFKAGVNCFGNKPEQGAITKAILPDNTVMPYNKNQWSRYSPGTSPPVVSPPLPPVTIHENCGGDGWSRTLTGPKVFNSGADYPSDVSYIRVPAGVTVVISYNGRSFTIVGPRDFNACGGSGDWYFNDKMSTIEIRATGSSDANSVATPPPAPPPPPLPAITIWQGCDKGNYSWTRKDLAGIPKIYRSDVDYPWDLSYIDVPSGVTAVLTGKTTPIYNVAGTGQVITLKGPTSLNLCSVGYGGGFNGFNDNIATIETRASSAGDISYSPVVAIPGLQPGCAIM
jgi:hypothetical protein